MISDAQAIGGLAVAAVPFILLMVFDLKEGPQVGYRDYAGCAVALAWMLKWTVSTLLVAAVCFAVVGRLWEVW